MCHDWWQRRYHEERESSRELWEEFERTTPISDRQESDEQTPITLERREQAEVATER
jgi:hypothetical protein